MRKNRECCKVSVRNGGSKHPPYGARGNVPFRKIITEQKHRGGTVLPDGPKHRT